MKGPLVIAGIVLPLTFCAAVIGWMTLRASDPYFPESILVERDCADHNLPAVEGMKLNRFHAELAESVLRGSQERPLYPRRDDETRILRFTWVRSFDPPVVVRIETEDDGSSRLFAQRAPGSDSCRFGSDDCTVSRSLTSTEHDRITTMATRAMAKPSFKCLNGLDGAVWLFETSGGGEYRVMHRWSPGAGPEHALGVAMLDLTGWRFETGLEPLPDDFWGEFAPAPDQTS